MASQNISKSQVLDLLSRLANDDEFRGSFKCNPETALTELNFPPAAFVGFLFDPARPDMLADKAVFAAAHKRMIDEVAGECLCMVQPGLWLNYGDQYRHANAAMQ